MAAMAGPRSKTVAAKSTAQEQIRQEADNRHCLRHDLRACVATINWAIAAMNKGNLTAAQIASQTERITRASIRLTRLVDELIDEDTAGALAAKESATEREKPDMKKVVDQSVTMLLP